LRASLEQMARRRATCLLLDPGQPPMVRVAGVLRALDVAALTPEELKGLAAHWHASSRHAKESNDGELRFLVKELDVGRLHVTVRWRGEVRSFELRPAFGRLRDTWGGISDAEYDVWRAHTYVDAMVDGIDADAPPFSRLLGTAMALGSAVRQMNRPDLARAAEALEARVRAHVKRQSTWDDTTRRETVEVAEQFRALLDRGPADDAVFAARVLAICQSDIEASKPVERVEPKTPGWKEAEQRWDALVGDFGAPTLFSSLSPDERTGAIAEHRALWVKVSRDGYGGGSVWFALMEAEQNDPSGRGFATFGLVFPAPCRLDAAVVRALNQNAWERGSEIPHLEAG